MFHQGYFAFTVSLSTSATFQLLSVLSLYRSASSEKFKLATDSFTILTPSFRI